MEKAAFAAELRMAHGSVQGIRHCPAHPRLSVCRHELNARIGGAMPVRLPSGDDI
jgi:hypothetical protein